MTTPVGFSSAWAEVLEKVEQALAHAEARAGELESVLAPEFAALPDPVQQASWTEFLDGWDTVFAGIEARVQPADRIAAETDTVLQAGEEVIRGWLKQSAAGRRNLAEVLSDKRE